MIAVTALSAPVFAQNLLKNGSFEGGKRYWYEAKKHQVVPGGASGEYSIRLEKGLVQSAAFELKNGVPVTLSFSAKAEMPTTIGWQLTPCAREIAMKNGLTWGMKAKNPVPLTTEWKRYSFTFTPNVPQDGLWPRPTYMVQIGDNDKPFLLDAVTVSYNAGADKYVPRRAVEVQVDTPDFVGYDKPEANTFPKGATVNLSGSAHNASIEAKNLTLRWQLFDYEGEKPVGEAIEKQITLAAGKTVTQSVPMPLSASGLVLARFSAIENGAALDSSDLPLTSLPYPKNATKPDLRERFGASFFGVPSAQKGAHVGFAWSRWFPHTKWQDHQPESADKFRWFDKELDALEGMGIASHLVLYGWPKWAMEEGKHPLPKDMRWAANDPRWHDLTPQTSWDKYMVETAKHYKGRAVVYEIENEPEFDGWEKYKDEYALFTTRSARLLKSIDPTCKVMVDNVYGIPSGINEHWLKSGGGKYVDIISWHDYHEGGLGTGTDIKRMKDRLEALGCGHIEIWFNEGWAYTNTAVDEPALALTNLNAAQSTNAMVSSIAEMTVAGQEKTIIFHSGYNEHGMSFWDYYGPGTMLWDFNDYPLPLVPAWNTLIHHVGLSKAVAWIRPEGANFCIFDDLRNKRGVMVAYADKDAKSDVTIALPIAGAIIEDCMGNAVPLQVKTLTLSKTGRPVFIYTADKKSGATFKYQLAPLDRKNASFVSATSFHLPPAWEGTKAETSQGNPAMANGKPIWQLSQIWPPDPTKSANYRPLIWRNGWWVPKSEDVGGQPKIEMRDSAIRMEFRAAHGEPRAERIASLSFIAPQEGTFTLSGSAALKLWDGNVPVRLQLLKKSAVGAVEIASLNLLRDGNVPLNQNITLKSGEELVIVPRPGGAFTGGDITLRDLKLSLGGATSGALYKLPAAWEGAQKGTAQGNPIKVGEQAIWRIDQLWPDKPIFTENYRPLPWSGTEWKAAAHEQGGQPAVKVENGSVNFAVRGPWTGNEGQKTAALVFIAPASGVYKVSGTAKSKPWEGGAEKFRLALMKKDTQRAAELKIVELSRDGTPVPFELNVELTAGHELVFLPLMPDWHNATNTTIEGLSIQKNGEGP